MNTIGAGGGDFETGVVGAGTGLCCGDCTGVCGLGGKLGVSFGDLEPSGSFFIFLCLGSLVEEGFLGLFLGSTGQVSAVRVLLTLVLFFAGRDRVFLVSVFGKYIPSHPPDGGVLALAGSFARLGMTFFVFAA